MIKTHKLHNGIHVITEAMLELRSVAIGIYVKTGSVYETKENNGIAHMIEHMMFKGTSRHNAKELADMMTMLGGNMNAYTAKECTSFYCKVLDVHLKDAIEILGDMICHSVFDPKDITKEKQVILDEIDMYDDSPEDMAHELLQKKIWSDNSLGYIISGSKKNVKSFKQKDIVEFYRENYISDNIYISVAGNFDEEYLLELLEKNFSDVIIKKDERVVCAPKYTPCFVKKHKDIEQVHINIAFDSPGYNSKFRYPMSVANAILGGSLNSRLFQHIREELGLTYSIYSYESLYKNSGLFHIYAAMNPFQVDYVLSELKKCVKIFTNKGVSVEELDKTKEQLITEYILGLESTNFRMENNAKYYMLQGKVETLDEIIDCINNVTLDDVYDYLNQYIKLSEGSLCVVGNMNELDITKLSNGLYDEV